MGTRRESVLHATAIHETPTISSYQSSFLWRKEKTSLVACEAIPTSKSCHCKQVWVASIMFWSLQLHSFAHITLKVQEMLITFGTVLRSQTLMQRLASFMRLGFQQLNDIPHLTNQLGPQVLLHKHIVVTRLDLSSKQSYTTDF